jgi:hypothetical protein
MIPSFAMSVIDIAKRVIKYYAQSNRRLETAILLIHRHPSARNPRLLRRKMYGAEYPASTVIRPRPTPALAAAFATLRPLPSPLTGLPRLPEPPFRRAVPTLPRRIERMRVSIASPLMQPSLNGRRVGNRIVTFDLLRLHSRYGPPVAQPLKAAFVTRLQPVTRPNRSSATRSIDNSLGGIFLH